MFGKDSSRTKFFFASAPLNLYEHLEKIIGGSMVMLTFKAPIGCTLKEEHTDPWGDSGLVL